jgi:4-amino-4-deoxy-L-arabinose transferase-like glycosyltransferase
MTNTGWQPGRPACAAVAAAVVCAALLLLTAPWTPMTWDEGDAIARAAEIPQAWPYTVEREGHPAFYGMLIRAGHWMGQAWLPPLAAYRLGPMLLFAMAVGAVFHRLASRFSPVAAVGGVAAMLIMPRLFAHVHYASFDGPLVSCWLLAWAAFPSEKPDDDGRSAYRRRLVLFALALGMAMSCKATGWLAPLPFVAWWAIFDRRQLWRGAPAALAIALATFCMLNPPLWRDSLGGLATFIQLNVNRAANPGLNISTQFFGQLYNLDHSLPWYNTLVWVGITVPVGILALCTVGIVYAVRNADARPAGLLLALNALTLLVARALPGMPPHDAERLILPSFAFLGLLAGLGCHALWQAAGSTRGRTLAAAGLVAVYLGSATSLVWYAPQWLSYYNLLIGGLPGATAMGMEPTYYWDGLDADVLDWLHANTAIGEKIHFAAAPEDNLQLMQQWGKLRRDWQTDAPGRFRWVVVQHRPSGLGLIEAELIARYPAAFEKTIRPAGWGPWRLDVPIVGVYDYADYARRLERFGGAEGR